MDKTEVRKMDSFCEKIVEFKRILYYNRNDSIINVQQEGAAIMEAYSD